MNISVTLNPNQTVVYTALDTFKSAPIKDIQDGMEAVLGCRVKINFDGLNNEYGVTAVYDFRAERSLGILMDEFKRVVQSFCTGIDTAKEPLPALTVLAKDIHDENREKGFWEHDRPLTETTMLIVSELAEAVEEEREGREEMWYGDDGKPEGVDVELVDALIRLLDLLGSRGVDVDEVMRVKRAYNRSRPKKHGKEY